MRAVRLFLLIALFALLQLRGDGALVAQSNGPSFEVTGVAVDVSAKTGTAAREMGWRLAQRRGWASLTRQMGAPAGSLPDTVLDQLVSGIVVENEQIGPTRYIARLGVRFDRARAAQILGVSGALTRSPPSLLLPIMWSGGAPVAFERKNEWLDAWGRFSASNSTIDYIRPAATGPDHLLLNAGQINRRSRGQWRDTLAQYGASDVLIPIVHLYREWPGGPILGDFQARFGPDNRLIAQFRLRVGNGDALPALLDAGVKRIDQAYQSALSRGVLRVDPSLLAAPAAETDDAGDELGSIAGDNAASAGAVVTLLVQVETPAIGAVDASQASLRGVPGVRTVALSSLALGGISVLRVGYEGDVASLRAALEARGWQVQQGGDVLRINRRAPSLPPPEVPPDNAIAG